MNDLLPGELEVLAQQLGSKIALYDHVAISDKIRANPQDYGLSNVDDPCQPVFPVEPRCSSPDEYYFWDEYHPTQRAHQITGKDMAQFVTSQQSASVPEPAAAFGSLILVGLLWTSAKRRG